MSEVYKAIAEVMKELAKEGIGKDRTNAQQGYKFRGIDDVYGALAPVLAKHSLCFLPRVLSRSVTERVSSNDKALFNVVVECEFDLVSGADGSGHTIRTFGEAMDSADKATNKAMSAAYKYAAFQAFCIPVEGEAGGDADADSPEVKASDKKMRQAPNQQSSSPTPPPAQPLPSRDPQQRVSNKLQTVRGVIEKVAYKEGTNAKGKHWERYGIKVGDTFYNTFSSSLGEKAKKFTGGTEMVLEWEIANDPKYPDARNCVGIWTPEEWAQWERNQADGEGADHDEVPYREPSDLFGGREPGEEG